MNDPIHNFENYLKQQANHIDTFLAGGAGMADLKNVIYTYVNQSSKADQLDNVSTQHFVNWMASGKVSKGKMERILELDKQQNNALDAIFKLVRGIQILKDTVIDQLESGPKADIWATNGEGYVIYAGPNKRFGNVKLVPRKRWKPA